MSITTPKGKKKESGKAFISTKHYNIYLPPPVPARRLEQITGNICANSVEAKTACNVWRVHGVPIDKAYPSRVASTVPKQTSIRGNKWQDFSDNKRPNTPLY